MANVITLIAQVAGVVHEIGEYSAPVLDHIIKIRSRGPKRPDTDREESVEETGAKIRAAIETAKAGQADARAELDKLDRKVDAGTKLDG